MSFIHSLMVKGFERYSGAAVSKFEAKGISEIALEQNEPVQVFQIQRSNAYVKTSTQQGWVPLGVLRLEKHRLTSDEIIEGELTLIVKHNSKETLVRPTFINTMGGVINVRIDLNIHTILKIAVKFEGETIGSLTIPTAKVLQRAEESDLCQEFILLAQCYKLHRIVLSLSLDHQIDDYQVIKKRTFTQGMTKFNEIALSNFQAFAIFDGLQIPGTILITSLHLYFSSNSLLPTNSFGLLIQSIHSLKPQTKSLQITTKDARIINFTLEESKQLFDLLTAQQSSPQASALAFFKISNPELLYIPLRSGPHPLYSEFLRLNCGYLRLSQINIDYSLCDTYPSLLYYPAHISDSVIKEMSHFRSKERVPAVTWCQGDVALFRSSQPKLGIGKRNADDEMFFSMAKIKYVIDARPGMNAKANRLKGKGYEQEEYYKIKLKFMDIQNIHHVTRSFEALTELCTRKKDFWLVVHESKWLSHVKLILDASLCSSYHLIIEKASILVHCSDGWDRTSQICSLTQILIDPYYRTILGIKELIIKDWFAFGHKFYDRTFGNDYSPIFLLFLDCLFQILAQFPEEFEFKQEFLIYLADSSVSGIYGEFMANNERERNDLAYRTESVWSRSMDEFRNRSFDPGFDKILPVRTEMQELQVWSFFTRHIN